jgi:hypothetical protein
VNHIGTIVNDINNAGVVVGVFSDSNGVIHGFAKNGDQYQTIDVPEADFTAIQGINSEGDVSGVYRATGVRHDFVLTHSSIMTFPKPRHSLANAFNDDEKLLARSFAVPNEYLGEVAVMVRASGPA